MSAFTDLQDQVAELSDNFASFSADYDNLVQSLGDIPQRPGQLDFPLDQQTTDLIKALFPTGSATLAAGTITVSSSYVSASSKIFLTRTALGAGTPGHLYISAQSAGSFTITSSSATDTSVVNYIIF
jgi:hypothetical protein